MRNHFCAVVIDLAVRHSERIEDSLPHECSKRLTVDDLNNLCQEHVVAVAIGPSRSGSEFESLRPQCRCDRLIASEVEKGHPWHTALARHVGVLVNSTGHVRQMLDAQTLTVFCDLRNILSDRIGESDLMIEDQQRDRGGSKLLRYRREVKGGLRRDRNAVVQIGEAIAP